jgi:hypothetical protein
MNSAHADDADLKYENYREQEHIFSDFLDLKSEKYLEYSLHRDSHQKVHHFYYPKPLEVDSELGFKNLKSIEGRHIARTRDKILFDSIYTTDSYGRRLAKISNPNRKHFVALFGCSFTFGHGVSDNQTLNFHLGKIQNDFYPYNYGVGASGPHMMLANLQKTDLRTEIPQKNGILIYVFINHHIDRANGHLPSLDWLKNSPYFEYNDSGDFVRKGNFLTGRPYVTKLLLGLHQILSRFGLGTRIFPPISDADQIYTCAILKKSNFEFQRQFPNGKFIVYFHPFNKPSRTLINCLAKESVPFELGTKLPDLDLSIEDDGHPTDLANQLIAKELAEILKKYRGML